MISVIIPTFNEANHIKLTIEKLRQYDEANLIRQIIVADGHSIDGTGAIAQQEGATVVMSPVKGRAAQMNYGASFASEKIMYFIHADTVPVQGFTSDIFHEVQAGALAGSFMLAFDHNHWFLKANCWFTRFDVAAFRYGDQSLFVDAAHFKKVNGFCEKHIVFEDYEIIRQLKRSGPFSIIKKPVITSARKYLDNGVFKMQGIFYLMYFLYRFRCSQQKLVSIYKRLIKQDKL
jgi:rSAM/selenodomain-associated transferase 2